MRNEESWLRSQGSWRTQLPTQPGHVGRYMEQWDPEEGTKSNGILQGPLLWATMGWEG